MDPILSPLIQAPDLVWVSRVPTDRYTTLQQHRRQGADIRKPNEPPPQPLSKSTLPLSAMSQSSRLPRPHGRVRPNGDALLMPEHWLKQSWKCDTIPNKSTAADIEHHCYKKAFLLVDHEANSCFLTAHTKLLIAELRLHLLNLWPRPLKEFLFNEVGHHRKWPPTGSVLMCTLVW